MSEKVTCAQRIREGLAIRDMTQADLCRITGIGKSAMSQYANGGILPRQDRTYLIAKALNVSEAWLMGFDVPIDRQQPTPATEDGLEDPLDKQLMEYVKKLTPDQKDFLLVQLKALTAQK